MGNVAFSNSAWWLSEWERRYSSRWQGIGYDKLVPLAPLNPTAFGPRILPEGNESVRAIRAIEAQIASLAPVKETP